MRHRAIIIVSLVGIIGLGCDTGIPPFDPSKVVDAALPTRCSEAAAHSDFAWVRDNVFAISCGAFTSCHEGSGPAGGLDLTAALAYQNLVNVVSTSFPDWIRVVPGDPDHSYILVKLGGIPGPLGDGGLMPLNNPLLCQPEIDAVRRWIAAGALPADDSLDAGMIVDDDAGL